jgi:hypothetical protein
MNDLSIGPISIDLNADVGENPDALADGSELALTSAFFLAAGGLILLLPETRGELLT